MIHHLVKEYSITKWFLTVERRAIEKKSISVSIVFVFIKPLHGRVVPHIREQVIYSQEIIDTNLY